MKKIFILTLIYITSFGLIISCNTDESSAQNETLDGIWNLTNVSGGFAGINDDYSSGVIKWTFNNQNSTLIVVNNNSQNTIYDGLDSGTYNYSTIESIGNYYISIENTEFNETGFTITADNLLLNQNETLFGSGADGFLVLFDK